MLWKKARLLLAVLFLVPLGCGRQESLQGTDPVVLAHQDIEAMATRDFSHLTGLLRDRFEESFSGLTGTDVRNYLEARAKVFCSDRNICTVTPGQMRFQTWSSSDTSKQPRKKIEIGAANVGLGLWLQSIFDETPYTLSTMEQRYWIDSPRAGIILFGRLYTDALEHNGRVVHPSRGFRQYILVHEARHSDCTGGLHRSSIAVARTSGSYEEYQKHFPDLICGHQHVTCPAGHELEGSVACDATPWGAYTMGWLFAEAVKNDRDIAAWETMSALAIESKSRLLFNTDDMMEGKLGKPDMRSQGVVD